MSVVAASPTSARTVRLLTLIWLILASVLWGGVTLASLLPIMFSPMLFDAPGSERRLILWVVLGSMLSLPITAITAVCLSWLLFALKRTRLAAVTMLLPLVSIVALVVTFVVWNSQTSVS